MAIEEQHTTNDPLRPNVRTFKPSSFQASEFEVVADGRLAVEFTVEQFAIVEGPVRTVDPMFEVYDDIVARGEQFVVEVLPDLEPSSFEVDLEIAEDRVEDIAGSLEEVPDASSTEEDLQSVHPEQPLEQEVPVVPASEIELLHQRFEEERLALQAEHEKQLEELTTTLQQELSAQMVAESDEKVRAIEERYRTIIDDMGTQIRQEVEGVERRAVELAIQVARKLVGTIVDINPEYILQVIQDAVKLTGGATIKAIRVSPQDLEFLKMLSPEKQFKEFDGSWSFQQDDSIRAGCVVETSSGEVEFDLDKTWERIKESVTKVR
jgi:flagellar assembly protein FliH